MATTTFRGIAPDFRVAAIEADSIVEKSYHLLVATLGFESRATHVSSTRFANTDKRFACAFTSRQVLAFERNRKWFAENRFNIEAVDDPSYRAWIRETLSTAQDTEQRTSICVDISSMSRVRIAATVWEILQAGFQAGAEVDFLYAPAAFLPPPHDEAPISTSAPVLDALSGWPSEPDRPTVAIFGLGYEPEKAVGTFEYLEPTEIWAFAPTGEDERYEKAVDKANSLLREVMHKDRIIRYRVNDPFDTIRLVESLSYGLLPAGRVVLVPFGPKIFSLCCVLSAAFHYPDIAVWRVSSDQFETPVDHAASGPIHGLRIIIPPGP